MANKDVAARISPAADAGKRSRADDKAKQKKIHLGGFEREGETGEV